VDILHFARPCKPTSLRPPAFYPTDLHTGTLGPGGRRRHIGTRRRDPWELLLVFGRQDPHVSAEGRRRIYEMLNQAGTCFTWHEFNAAHAFLRDEDERLQSARTPGMALAADLFGRCCDF